MKKLTDKSMLLITMLVMVLFVLATYVLIQPQKRLFKADIIQKTSVNTEPLSTVYFPRTDTTVAVEIAKSDDQITLGLSYRDQLAEGTGMLFDLGYEDTYPSFWMKGMHFPLDFIWINNDTVVDLHTDVKNHPIDTPDNELPLYRPKKPVDKILEVNAGFVSHNDIQIGDTLNITIN